MSLLREAAEGRPRARLYNFGDAVGTLRTWTYADVDRAARRLAARLVRHVRAGDRVLVLCPPGEEYVAALFGCLYAGAVPVPVYPPDPGRLAKTMPRLTAIIRGCGAELAVISEPLAELAKPVLATSDTLPRLTWLTVGAEPTEDHDRYVPPEVSPDALAILQYTSGSTGTPRGVMLSHQNVLHNLSLIVDACGITPADRVVSWLPPYHDMGLIGGILVPLFAGIEATLMPPTAFLRKPFTWLEAISARRATISVGPNFAYDYCVRRVSAEERSTLDLRSWRLALTGAEPIRAATLDGFLEAFEACGFRGSAFYPCYGLAEATLMVTGGRAGAGATRRSVSRAALLRHEVRPPDDDEPAVTIVSSGRALGGQIVRIVHPESGEPCAEGAVGEIWVAGPSIAMAYFGDPTGTASVFGQRLAGHSGAFLRTGDLGFIDDGDLYVTGRIKDVVIVRGRNYYPHDLEAVVERAHPALRPGGGAAFSVDDGDAERLVIVQEIDRRARVTPSAVIDAIRAALSTELEVSADAVVLIRAGSLPKTSSGKVQRHECRRRYVTGMLEIVSDADGRAAAGGLPAKAVEPATSGDTPQRLRKAIGEALQIAPERIDPSSPLPSLGLDSVAAVQIEAAIEKEFGRSVPMATMIGGASLNDLAELLNTAPQVQTAHAIPDADSALSANQRALWFLDEVSDIAGVHNLARAALVKQPVNVAVLQRALDLVVARHAVLRSVFDASSGEVRQRVLDGYSTALDVRQAGGLSVAEIMNVARDEAARPFEPHRPRLRVVLFDRGADAVLLVVTHHLVTDFWSLTLFCRDVGAAYQALGAGTASWPLAPAVSSLGAVAAEEQVFLASAEGARNLEFWESVLLPPLPPLELPYDRPAGARRSHAGAAVRFGLGTDVSTRVRQYARSQGITQFTVLLAAFELLLHRYTGQAQFVVGTMTSGRGRSALDETMNYLLNPLPLQAACGGDPSFTEMVHRVRDVLVPAFEHRAYPFAEMVQRLRPRESAPIIQAMFIMQRAHLLEDGGLTALALGHPGARLRLGGLDLELLELPEIASEFELTLVAGEVGDELVARIDFQTDLWNPATVERMAGHLTALLAGALAEPDRPATAISLLTPHERAQLEQWNATDVAYDLDHTIDELFEAQVVRTPSAVAVIDGSRTVTFAALNARANQVAHHLIDLGVREGDVVGVCAERSAEAVAGFLGVLKAQAAYVPLSQDYPAERIAFMASDAHAQVVLVQRAHAARVPGGCTMLLDDDNPALAAYPTTNPPRRADPDRIAYVMYTSGSTGRPKGVLTSHRGVLNRFNWLWATYPGGPIEDEVWCLKTSLNFSDSMWEMFGSLLKGIRLVAAPSPTVKDPELLIQLLTRHRVTQINVVPSQLRVLVDTCDAFGESLPGLDIWTVGGEPLAPDLAHRFPRVFPGRVLLNIYGCTEITSDATCFEVRGTTGREVTVPIGRPMGNVKVYILDASRQQVPIGVVGELYIGGKGVGRYLGRPELDAERFLPDPFVAGQGRMYRTGDRGRYRADGSIECLGRVDHQVKIRGFRIEPAEIEAALIHHEAVAQALVVPADRGPDDKLLVAYVVAKPELGATATELADYLRAHLPDYMVPAAFVFLPAFPSLPNGKIDRGRLPAPTDDARATDRYVAPRGDVERTIASVFAEVLQLHRVGARDNFFHVGGDSLLVTRARARLRDVLGVELPLRTLFESPTVEDLAARVPTTSRVVESAIERQPGRDTGPLSFAQERLWFLDQLDPGSAVLNISAAVRIRGALDRGALHAALQEIAHRHEILRTVFDSSEPPRQRVLESIAVPLECVVGSGDAEEALHWAAERARCAFDLRHGPLWRADLLQRADNDHVLVLTLHHIVADGWSVALLIRELVALYAARRADVPAIVPDLSIQYIDYAVWQRRSLAGAALDDRLRYWVSHLAGAPTAVDLPMARHRPATQSFAGASLRRRLPSSLIERLRELGRREGATLFGVLLTAFNVLVARCSGQRDLVIGTSVANRPHAELEAIIGCFINVLALRTDLSDDAPFLVQLGRTMQTIVDAQAHQEVPFERVIAELKPPRDLSRSPVFQIMFDLRSYAQAPLSAPGLDIEELPVARTTARYDLTLAATETAEGLECVWEYASALFDEASIERLAASFEVLLGSIVERPHERWRRLPILRAEERQQLLNVRSGRGRHFPVRECIHEWFGRVATARPTAVAVVDGDRRLTFQALDERANRIAHRLVKRGVTSGSIVAIWMERSSDVVAAMLGVLKAGAAYLPIDPGYPGERVEFMLSDSRAAAIVVDGTTIGHVDPTLRPTVSARDETLADEPASPPARSATPSDLAYVIYTSGSTGVPKGCLVTHANVVRLFLATADWFHFDERDVWTMFHSAAFDFSVWEIWGALLHGGRLVIVSYWISRSPEEFHALLCAERVTVLNQTPSAFRELAAADERAPITAELSLRLVIFGGEALAPEILRQWFRRHEDWQPQMVNMYGITETTVHVTRRVIRAADVRRGVGSVIGEPIPDLRVYVLDEHLQPQPVGIPGELFVGGDGVSAGYLGRPELTAARFIDDPFGARPGGKLYRSGDVARVLADGDLEYLGRTDNQVKIRGFRIEVTEVEVVLAQHPEIAAAGVVVRADTSGAQLRAFVVPRRSPLDVASVLEFLRTRLPSYMIPALTVCDSLPLTVHGKLDRRALAQLDVGSTAPSPTPEPPISETEQVLARMFAEVLEIDSVGRRDNFFELGGHSLLATRVMTRVRTAFHIDLPLRSFYESPTVAELSRVVEWVLIQQIQSPVQNES